MSMNKITETVIEADPKLPVIRMTRDFAATPAQLFRAHTDPALFARWVGPDAMDTRIEHWDAQTGGSWRYASVHDGTEYWFHAASTRYGRTASCRPSRSRAIPRESRWRRCGSRT